MPNSSAASEPTARDLQSSLFGILGRCDSRPNRRVCSVLSTAMFNPDVWDAPWKSAGLSRSISYFLDAIIGPLKVRHSKYAPRAARVTPPTKATPKILVSQKSSSTTKYRPATSIAIELINMLTFLMLPSPHHIPRRQTPCAHHTKASWTDARRLYGALC